MVKFATVPGLYTPHVFNGSDYANYLAKQAAIGEATEALANQLKLVQTALEKIVSSLLPTIEQHHDIKTPIFFLHSMGSRPSDSNYPLLRTCNRLKEFTRPFSAAEIIRVIKGCISSYQSNELDYGFEQDSSLNAEFQPVVREAHQAGERLARFFAPTLAALEEIEHQVTPFHEQIEASKAEFEQIKPKNKATQALQLAFNEAIANILAAVEREIQTGNSEAGGIRGVCNEFAAKVASTHGAVQETDLDRIIRGFTTLQHIQPNSFADQQLSNLKLILAAHNANVKLMSKPSFDEDTIGEIKAYAPDVTHAVPISDAMHDDPVQTPDRERGYEPASIITAPVLSPAATLKNMLDLYIRKRSSVIDTNHKTKEYFRCSIFSFFQNSYTQEKQAIEALSSALDGNDSIDLLSHLAVLRAGNLGRELRAFIKEGRANAIVGADVTRVRDFVYALTGEEQLSSYHLCRVYR